MRNLIRLCFILGTVITMNACSINLPMKTVDYVDLERFMGRWYVIANIPTFLERNAFNAIERYELNSDGSIDTRFSFIEGDFSGELKQYRPTGFIKDDTNARWGMQFIWPIQADYRIVYLDDSYSRTIIARQARDYVWLMAREPKIDDLEYESFKHFIKGLGYDTAKLQKVPQQWHLNGEIN